MRAILITTLILYFLPVMAQRECFVSKPSKEVVIDQPTIQSIQSTHELFGQVNLSKDNTPGSSGISGVIRIPVVVHVLYNSADQNISDEQVRSQIDALNKDFRKRNSDTVNIPERFKPFAADVEIEFELAVVSPQGYATNGIVRKQTTVKEWVMDDKIKFSVHGGNDAWDSRSYLNIWVGNVKRTLGYSSVINGPAEKDGIVISNTVFGTIGRTGAFNKGRTLVHEVGHWLGLKHIWGDDACGDDGVDDTPKQAGFTTGCPSGFRVTCGSSLGDMYMNFMDFTNDACMNMFTQGQKQRMRSLFMKNGYRYSLLASKGLDTSNIKEAPVAVDRDPGGGYVGGSLKNPSEKAALYPNPADRELTLNLSEDWIEKEFRIVDINGVTVKRSKIQRQVQAFSVATLKQGIYFIILEGGSKRLVLKFIKTGPGRN